MNNSFDGKENCVECRKKYYKFSSVLWDSKIKNIADISWKDNGVVIITKILNVLNGLFRRVEFLEEKAKTNSFDIQIGYNLEELKFEKVIGEFEFIWEAGESSLIIKTNHSIKSIKNDYTGEELLMNFTIDSEDVLNIYTMFITKPFSTNQKIIIK